MEGTTISAAVLTKAALKLYDEGYAGPPDPKGTWFVDNEPDCGFLGTIGKLSADRASRPTGEGDSLTVASHTAHLRFALALANRAARGDNAYAGAKWSESWTPRAVSEAEWRSLVAALRAEYDAFREVLAKGDFWNDEDILTGTLGLLCHGAWHLGAIRQALGLVKAPGAS
jgi:hypothetical protein